MYRQGDRTRQDRLRNRHRCYLHSNPGHGHQRQDKGTEGLDVTVLADIKMIACAGEAPAQVVCRQVVLRIAAVAAGGGTMDDDKIDESHEN